MTLEKLKELDNKELLHLYAMIVAIDHYDAFVTPRRVRELYDANIRQEDLAEIILERMK